MEAGANLHRGELRLRLGARKFELLDYVGNLLVPTERRRAGKEEGDGVGWGGVRGVRS